MQENNKIDNWILFLLHDKITMYWTQIYNEICASYQHVSIDAFDHHMAKMINEHLILRHADGGKGKKVHYSLTDKAKLQLRLKIIRFKYDAKANSLNRKDGEERRQILYLILFFLYLQPVFKLEGETELKNFLSQHGLSRKDLRVSGKQIEVDKDMKRVADITWYRQIADIDIWRRKELLNESQKNQVSHKNTKISYEYTIPAYTITEILHDSRRKVFCHLHFTRSEVEEAVHQSMEEGLLESINRFSNGGETRYQVSNRLQRSCLQDFSEFYRSVEITTYNNWVSIRGTKKEEQKWLQTLHGPKDSFRLMINLHTKRKQRYTLSREEKELEEIYDSATKRDLKQIPNDWLRLKKEYVDKDERYGFLAEKFLEVTCPKSLLPSIP